MDRARKWSPGAVVQAGVLGRRLLSRDPPKAGPENGAVPVRKYASGDLGLDVGPDQWVRLDAWRGTGPWTAWVGSVGRVLPIFRRRLAASSHARTRSGPSISRSTVERLGQS